MITNTAINANATIGHIGIIAMFAVAEIGPKFLAETVILIPEIAPDRFYFGELWVNFASYGGMDFRGCEKISTTSPFSRSTNTIS